MPCMTPLPSTLSRHPSATALMRNFGLLLRCCRMRVKIPGMLKRAFSLWPTPSITEAEGQSLLTTKRTTHNCCVHFDLQQAPTLSNRCLPKSINWMIWISPSARFYGRQWRHLGFYVHSESRSELQPWSFQIRRAVTKRIFPALLSKTTTSCTEDHICQDKHPCNYPFGHQKFLHCS